MRQCACTASVRPVTAPWAAKSWEGAFKASPYPYVSFVQPRTQEGCPGAMPIFLPWTPTNGVKGPCVGPQLRGGGGKMAFSFVLTPRRQEGNYEIFFPQLKRSVRQTGSCGRRSPTHRFPRSVPGVLVGP